jgi:hypothetical protein
MKADGMFSDVESETTSRSKQELRTCKKEILDRHFFIIFEQVQTSCTGSINICPV